MRVATAILAFVLSAACFGFVTLFAALVGYHVFGEVQFGGWGQVPSALGDVEGVRWIVAGVALSMGLVFLCVGCSLLPKQEPPAWPLVRPFPEAARQLNE